MLFLLRFSASLCLSNMTTSLLSADKFRSHLLLLILIPLFCFSDSHDSPYDICSQATCGSLIKISYPFGLSNSGCGNPDFQIECVSNNPLLTINGINYRILERELDNQTTDIKIANDRVFAHCGLPEASVNLSGSPFHLADAFEYNLTLVVGCTPTIFSDLISVICDSTWRFTLYQAFPWTSWDCSSVVGVPIQTGETANALNLFSLLRKGFQIEWDTNGVITENCKNCTLSSKGICGYNVSDYLKSFLCYYPENKHGEKSQSAVVIGVCIGVAGVIATAAVTAVCLCKRDRPPKQSIPAKFSTDNRENKESGALPSERGSVPFFSYEELEQGTNNFAKQNELGDGGFGSVYLGNLQDGRVVAVKRMYQDNSRRLEQFDNEVRILSSLSHPNLVRLIGYCHARRELLLVYEYVSNGTLADHLHGKQNGSKDLPWGTRLNIAVEAAEALAYLHFCVKPPIYHRDVKSTNILLDENFKVKVADFGLSRLVPLEVTHVSTAPQGTPGYLDPDYHQSYRLTDKSDVYSFGVVLVELISAKKAVDITRDKKEVSLANLAISKIQGGALHELVDPNLGIEFHVLVKGMVTSVAELAFRCLATEKDDRPNMMEVAARLLQIKQVRYSCSNKHLSLQISFEDGQETRKLLSGMSPFSPTSVQGKVLL
eukprot:Gb_08341 [translate_table: standard]